MNFDQLKSIDWGEFESTAEWTKLLNDLLGLALEAKGERCDELADYLDEFADHSTSDDLDVIAKLDRAARKAARALRITSISERVTALEVASDDFHTVVKEFSAVSVALKKETSKLRLEKLNATVVSLTDTIVSLKALSQVTLADDDKILAAAIEEAVGSAQKLRGLIEGTA